MALTKIGTSGIEDDAVTTDKLANAINTERTANTAKDLTALSATNLTSGTIPDARFPATLPAASAANLTAVPAANITGTLPAISGANLTSLTATNLTGTIADARFPATLPAASAANLTNVPAANITGTLPAISGANLTNLPASGKATNLVINGAMTVAQRADATPAVSSTSAGIACVDRFGVSVGGLDENPTQTQADVASGTTPYTLGFRKALKVTNGNQSSGAGSGDRLVVYQNVEAQNIAQSGWNYTSASSNVTFSFWAKSSVAQTFYFLIGTDDGSIYRYGATMTFSSTDTWTKFTYTIPGNSNLTFNSDNGRGLQIFWVLWRGTDFTTSGFTLNQWAAYDSANRVPDMTSTWFTTNDATFELTGVLFEVGETASDYPHESYAETLTKCERYYQQCRQNIYGMTQDTNARVLWVYPLKVEMRDGPSVTATSTEYRFGNQINAAHGVSGFSINRSGYGDAKTVDFAPTRSSSSSATTAKDMQFLEPTTGQHATFQFTSEI